MRTFVIGNIQGHYEQFMQCLESSRFDYAIDKLIILGNITGYGPNTAECIEEIIKIRNKVLLVAGHDEWFRNWLSSGHHYDNWETGGTMTLLSYLRYVKKEVRFTSVLGKLMHNLRPTDIPEDHQYLFMKRRFLHVDSKKRLFVTAGIDHTKNLEGNLTNKALLCWDRTLWHKLAIQKEDLKFANDFLEVYISDYGVYESLGVDYPVNINIVWNIGTSYRNNGRLTIMDVETKEYHQSDVINIKHCTFL